MTIDHDVARGSSAGPGPVRRLTFGYDGDQIRLVDEQHVEMTLPPTRNLDVDARTRRGFSVVLRDGDDRPVYRLTRTSPMRHNAEIFAPAQDGALHRRGLEHPSGTFVVLVPEVPGARTVELIGHPLRPEAHQEPPSSLARITLGEYGVE